MKKLFRTRIDFFKDWRNWNLDDCLFLFCGMWTIVMMTMSILVFMKCNFIIIPQEMPVTYLFILASYVFKKEIKRWKRQRRRIRRGEFFFWAWSFLIFIMHLINSLSGDIYQIPKKTREIFCYVLFLYVSSEVSKHCSKKHRAKALLKPTLTK
jgi:hypothetical protein